MRKFFLIQICPNLDHKLIDLDIYFCSASTVVIVPKVSWLWMEATFKNIWKAAFFSQFGKGLHKERWTLKYPHRKRKLRIQIWTKKIEFYWYRVHQNFWRRWDEFRLILTCFVLKFLAEFWPILLLFRPKFKPISVQFSDPYFMTKFDWYKVHQKFFLKKVRLIIRPLARTFSFLCWDLRPSEKSRRWQSFF